MTKSIQHYEALHFCPFHRRRCQRRLVRRQVRGRRRRLQEEVQQGRQEVLPGLRQGVGRLHGQMQERRINLRK